MSMKTIVLGVAAATAIAAVATPAQADTAVLAGGCFWGMESVFEHVKGVSDVVSGYAGGSAATAHYEDSDSGHAEAVRITYDPRQISYAQLLQVYFVVAHDPTQVNRQSPDVGTSYRSAIFPQNAIQAAQAKAFIARLTASHAFSAPIATRIEQGGFYPAEAHHQDFARKNPSYPYIVVNDRPKVVALKRRYPDLYHG
ncbi:MAG: peptide-methionine (S)-S-oxide reductase MsrA [Sphingomicrobium sp.]